MTETVPSAHRIIPKLFSRQKHLRVFLFLVFGIIILLLPTQENCGTANKKYKLCTYPPDESGYITRYYEVQPVIASIVEMVGVRNFPITYSSGYHYQKLKQK